MKAEFTVNNVTRTFYNIVGIDLDMYDEIMISSMSCPEFSITLPFNIMSNGDDEFSDYWKSLVVTNTLPYIRLYDITGLILTEGQAFEYTEDCENYELSIKLKSALAIFLDTSVSFQNKCGIFTFGHNSDIRGSLALWIRDIFMYRLGKLIFFNSDLLAYLETYILNNIPTSSPDYFATSIFWSFSGKRYDLIKNLAKILNAKITYDQATDSFIATPLNQQYGLPISVTGYLSSCTYKESTQTTLEDNFIESFTVKHLSTNKLYNITSGIYTIINNQIYPIIQYMEYEIWGYCNQILNTGQTILLDGTNYYLKEISYEYDRLDDAKCFTAKAVRFKD